MSCQLTITKCCPLNDYMRGMITANYDLLLNRSLALHTFVQLQRPHKPSYLRPLVGCKVLLYHQHDSDDVALEAHWTLLVIFCLVLSSVVV